ncbi:MAG TPA: hypothetical protein DEA96_06040 [Leptospiraceae bacterium]|nr:hypothetical protein [Leptospiraceae bacterium]
MHGAADRIRADIGNLDSRINQAVESITNQNPEWLLEFLRRRRKDHLKWMASVDAAIAAMDAEAFPQLDHTKCNMGLWIYKAVVSSDSQRQVHDSMEEPHRRLHATASEIADMVSRGEGSGIDSKRKDLGAVYEEIADRFDEYERYLEDAVLNDLRK